MRDAVRRYLIALAIYGLVFIVSQAAVEHLELATSLVLVSVLVVAPAIAGGVLSWLGELV
jgi:hypothetical protein